MSCLSHPPSRLALLGLAAGIAGGFTMNLFTRIASGATGGHEAEGAAPGPDRVGRGMQPPQADGRADEDAAVRLGTAVYGAVTGERPARVTRRALGTAAHYAFSAANGIAYMFLAERVPATRRCFGAAYGTLVWGVADEGLMPALGLSRGPHELSPGLHLYSLAGHWIFGATLEAFRRAALSRS
jgi:hypothetical protein